MNTIEPNLIQIWNDTNKKLLVNFKCLELKLSDTKSKS